MTLFLDIQIQHYKNMLSTVTYPRMFLVFFTLPPRFKNFSLLFRCIPLWVGLFAKGIVICVHPIQVEDQVSLLLASTVLT